MKQINWGIIGCGDVTEIKSGPAFNKVPNSKLLAVMRRNADKARDYAERHGVPTWYSKDDELIHDDEINAIYVATPPDSHEAYTIAALKAGKDVYVEKPMSLNAMGCQSMVEAANEYGKKLCVAHYRREQPFFKKIKSLVTDGSIGQVRTVELQMQLHSFSPEKLKEEKTAWRIDPKRSGGGIFHDLAPHQLDILYHLFGNARIVKGVSLNQSKKYPADDAVAAILCFENDILFTGTWNFNLESLKALDECIITGTKGKIIFHFFKNTKIKVETNHGLQKMIFDPLEHVQQPMIAAVVKYFSGETDINPSPGTDAVITMQWMDEITRKG